MENTIRINEFSLWIHKKVGYFPQNCVLSHITTQIKVVEVGAKAGVFF
ncbi:MULTISPECIES: hypothetical protein [Caldanaerobacter]|jgi:ethanolamine ammonia-lyase large subunit|nr:MULTISPECIES: hypothetical protein [Caldanaerobacter]KUJ90058.1 MAG: hypothetical protein XD37_1715 [Thermoanaerobacter thermocopriae]MDI3519827.1 hypothetical protein [Caldanaerobacter sp.]